MKKQPTKKNKGQPQSYVHALNFFAEAGLLKNVKRSGWWVAGIQNPESVAEHSFRTAVIGFYLAHLEDADPFQVVSMALFNDIHESRINDLHKMGHYYIDFKDAEKKVFKDQVAFLDERIKMKMEKLREDYDQQATQESLIARDADILECLIQAKEYYDAGHKKARHFFARAANHLKTESAKAVWKSMNVVPPAEQGSSRQDQGSWESCDWWQNIVKFER